MYLNIKEPNLSPRTLNSAPMAKFKTQNLGDSFVLQNSKETANLLIQCPGVLASALPKIRTSVQPECTLLKFDFSFQNADEITLTRAEEDMFEGQNISAFAMLYMRKKDQLSVITETVDIELGGLEESDVMVLFALTRAKPTLMKRVTQKAEEAKGAEGAEGAEEVEGAEEAEGVKGTKRVEKPEEQKGDDLN